MGSLPSMFCATVIFKAMMSGLLFFFPLELTKTLIVTGLNEKTTAETLKNAFNGAVSARVIVNKKTSFSKRWVVLGAFYFHTMM